MGRVALLSLLCRNLVVLFMLFMFGCCLFISKWLKLDLVIQFLQLHGGHMVQSQLILPVASSRSQFELLTTLLLVPVWNVIFHPNVTYVRKSPFNHMSGDSISNLLIE